MALTKRESTCHPWRVRESRRFPNAVTPLIAARDLRFALLAAQLSHEPPPRACLRPRPSLLKYPEDLSRVPTPPLSLHYDHASFSLLETAASGSTRAKFFRRRGHSPLLGRRRRAPAATKGDIDCEEKRKIEGKGEGAPLSCWRGRRCTRALFRGGCATPPEGH